MPVIPGTVASSKTGNLLAAPLAPTIGTATDVGTNRPVGDGAASVTFTQNGGPATSFTVRSTPGSTSLVTATGTASPITVTGLQDAGSYAFTVTATNSVGTSSSSAESNSITVTTVPGAPTLGVRIVGTGSDRGKVFVPVTGGNTGGKAISSYTATSETGGYTGTGTASPITISGLPGGVSYRFTVTATNANGTSLPSVLTAYSYVPLQLIVDGGTLVTPASDPNYYYRVFTSTGTYAINVTNGAVSMETIIIGGGGGGGYRGTSGGLRGGGGGGAGKLTYISSTPQSYAQVIIGAAVAGMTNGNSCSFGGVTSAGGVKGTDAGATVGGAGGASGNSFAGGTTSSQAGGGGGGSGAVGSNAVGTTAGAGGAGITGYSTWWTAIGSTLGSAFQTATSGGRICAGGGGGGGTSPVTGTSGAGGSGGGGAGSNTSVGATGAFYTGSGGGGGGLYGGTGGQGLVVVRYLRSDVL